MSARREADLLRRFVDSVSHGRGAALALMADAGVTLPQILLMARVQRAGAASITGLIKHTPGTAAAMSQMVDRLVRQGWLSRREDARDRRRKSLALTSKGATLLHGLERARTQDYAAGLSRVSPHLRAALRKWLEQALAEIETGGSP
jgi:DNA-binding MarR family transcriptional regulator